MIDAAGPAPASPWQQAAVRVVQPLTSTITRLVLAPRAPFLFRAGQHVDVRLTAEDGYQAIRSYSIGSSPMQSQEIELCIERLEDGEVSPFFHEVVRVGDEIEIRGPLGGHFVWERTEGGPLLLIGSGSGVVPLMSMVRYRQACARDIPVTLLLSARTWQDVVYRDELLAADSARDGFTLVLTLTRDTPRREQDYDRRIDAAIIGQAVKGLPLPPAQVFICGSNGVVTGHAGKKTV
jgi:ferredoxin-NADP reductase